MGQFATDAFGERLGFDSREAERLHDRKLVAAKTNDEVGGPRERKQAVGDPLEHNIAERMSVGVVDELESVEVDNVQRKGAFPCRQREERVEMFAKMPAIG